MTPLERAARAIFEARRSQAPCIAYPAITGEWDAQFASVKDRYVNEACAVLTAIQEPDDAMIRAGEAWQLHCSDVDSLYGEMIGVAINGPKC